MSKFQPPGTKIEGGDREQRNKMATHIYIYILAVPARGIFVPGDFLSRGISCPWGFLVPGISCPGGFLIPRDFLSWGISCPGGFLVPGDFLSREISCPGRFLVPGENPLDLFFPFLGYYKVYLEAMLVLLL